MELIDLYLKADNEIDMTAALKAAGFIADEESGSLYHPEAALDVIGTIYQPTGEKVIVDGVELDAQAGLPGYHVNVRTTSDELSTALDAQRTYPVTPVRVWA